MKIVIISCVSKKLPHKARARKLYTSPLFKLNLQYAKSLQPDKIFILSAKYGLLDLEQEIEPYNKTLNQMSKKEREMWAHQVLTKLNEQTDPTNDEFIFLAGKKYREFLVPHLKHFSVPMKALGIGKQLAWLKQQLQQKPSICHNLHTLFNSMKRFTFSFPKNEIPKNGIYVLFQKGESAHSADRIVRIGTHTGTDQLTSRLFQHFLNENKDRSIFRKNIGRAILNKAKDSFLEQWELDLTTRAAKQKYKDSIDFQKQHEVEKQVSQFIQNNFSFVVFPVEDKANRLKTESKLISTVSLCKDCKPSPAWLGLHSPKQKIRESGLWLVNELYKEPFTEQEFEKLKP